MPDVLTQTIDPPLRRGEDARAALSGTFTTDPTDWAVTFTMRRGAAELELTTAGGAVAVSVTGGGPYSATWTVTVPAASSAALTAGTWLVELARTDSGGRTVLAAGVWPVLDPVTDFG